MRSLFLSDWILRAVKGGLDPAFVATTALRYTGPVLLTIFAPVFMGAGDAKTLFIILSVLLLGVTIGKLGIDNEILKLLADGERKVGLRWTLLVWMPVSGGVTAFAIQRWGGGLLSALDIGVGMVLLTYCVLYIQAIVAALMKSRGATSYVQLYEFGAFQFFLFVALGVVYLAGRSESASFALLIPLVGYGAAQLYFVIREREIFFRPEVWSLELIRERFNCFVPNMITYVGSWGLLLPLAEVEAVRFAEINAALRIAASATAITAVGNLLGIRDTSLPIRASFDKSRRIGILLLAFSAPFILVGYSIAMALSPVVPDPRDPFVLVVYIIHVAGVLVGPTLFYANVAGQHRRINFTFLGLVLLVGAIYVLPLAGSIGFLILLAYIRVVSRVCLSLDRYSPART